ncbi:MAG: DUF434 domain-containing protein, partial [Bacillota bacterium]|nr:DUF434 domain-containing protein [Bacillota bacterium]
MSPQATRRGYNPQDISDFSPEALYRLRLAQQELLWLLDRGYPMNSASNFVCGHHQLTSRQRSALQRATDRSVCLEKRQLSRLTLDNLKNGPLMIDGFNLIITLETALSGSLLVLGADGVLRDLAGLRGTYRIIEQTSHALDLIGSMFSTYAVPAARFYLDAPVSNSGRLKQEIVKHAASWSCQTQVELVPDADAYLSGQERIVSSDSVILDQCRSWFNLVTELTTQMIPQAW